MIVLGCARMRLERLLIAPSHWMPHRPGYMPTWVISLLNLSRFSESEAALRKACDLDPSVGSSWSMLGDVLLAESRREEALEAYKKGLAVAASDADRCSVARFARFCLRRD